MRDRIRLTAASVGVGVVAGHFMGFILMVLVACALCGVLMVTSRRSLSAGPDRKSLP